MWKKLIGEESVKVVLSGEDELCPSKWINGINLIG